MSQFQFILGVTIVVVAGTLAFTFHSQQSEKNSNAPADPPHLAASFRSSQKAPSSNGHPSRSKSSTEPGYNKLGVAQASLSKLNQAQRDQVDRILHRTRQEARQQLDQLTNTYRLSPGQQKEIFPLIVAHHHQAHPSMLVGGQPIPAITPGATLAESIYPLLDPDQQDLVTEAALDNEAWWKDVVDQLETDLDQAIEGGEMVAAPDDSANPTGVIPSDKPTAGDGEASTHSGGNLFDLLGK